MKSVIHSPLPPLPTNKQQQSQRYHANHNQFQQQQQQLNQHFMFDKQHLQIESKSPQKQATFSSHNIQQRFSPQMNSQLVNVPFFYSPQHQKNISSSSSSFLSRAAQKIGLSTKKKSIEKVSVKKPGENLSVGNLNKPIQQNIFPPYQQPLQTLMNANTFFHHFSSYPPPLSKNFFLRCSSSSKVKIMVKINGSNNEKSPCISVDPFKRHISVFNPLSSYNRPAQFPKAFAYDAIFNDDDSLHDLCEEGLADVVNGVLNGYDTCFLSYGHSRTEKEQSMFGCIEGQTSFGLIPTCLSWMCQLTEHHNTNNNLNITPHNIKNSCSLAVSAFQITTKNIKDLLNPSAHITINSDGTQLKGLNRCDIINTAHAGHVIDTILANKIPSDTTDSSIHTFFIIYLIRRFQSANSNISKNFYEKIYKISFIDLDCKHSCNVPGGMTLNSFGLVILALLSGQREIPFRENKTAALLKTMMVSSNGHTSVLVHVSNKNSHLKESYQLLHLAAKMNKSGRKKNSSKSAACSESGGGRRTRKGVRMGTLFYSSACEGGFQTSDGEQLSTAGSMDSDDGFRPTPQSLSCAALDPVFEESPQPLQIMQQQQYQRRRTYKSNPSSTVSAPAYCQRKILAERTNKFSDLNNGVSNSDLCFEKINKISTKNYKIKYNNLVKRNFNQNRHNTKELWIDGPNVKSSFICSSEKLEMNNLEVKDVKNDIDMGEFNGVHMKSGAEKWVDGPDSFIAIPPLSKFSKIVKVSSLNNNFFSKLEQNIDSATNYIITGNSEMALKNTSVKVASANISFDELNNAKNTNLTFEDFSPTSSEVPVDHSTPYATLEKFDVLHQTEFNGDSHEILANNKKDDFRSNLDSVVEQATELAEQDNFSDATLKAVLRTHDNSMYLTNRESLYEIKMDQNLEVFEHNSNGELQVKRNTLHLQEDTLAKRIDQENDSIWNISTCTSLKRSLQTKDSTDWQCSFNNKTDDNFGNFQKNCSEECNYTNCGKFDHEDCVLNSSGSSKVNCGSSNASDFSGKLQVSVSKETVKTAVVSKIKMLDSDEDCNINIPETRTKTDEANEIMPQNHIIINANDAFNFKENNDAFTTESNKEDGFERHQKSPLHSTSSGHEANINGASDVSCSESIIEHISTFDNALLEISVVDSNKERMNESKEEFVEDSNIINSSDITLELKSNLSKFSPSKSNKSTIIGSKIYEKPSLLQKLRTPILFRNKKNLPIVDENIKENAKMMALKSNNNTKVFEHKSPIKANGLRCNQAPKKSKIPVTASMLDNNFKLNETNMKVKSNFNQKISQNQTNNAPGPTLKSKNSSKSYDDSKIKLTEPKKSGFFSKKEINTSISDENYQKVNVNNIQKHSKNFSPFKSKNKFKKSNTNQLIKSDDFVYTSCHEKPPSSVSDSLDQPLVNNLFKRSDEEISNKTIHTHHSGIKGQEDDYINRKELFKHRTSILLNKSVFCGVLAAASVKAVSLASFCLNANKTKKFSNFEEVSYNGVLYSSLTERKVTANVKTKKCNSLGNIYTYL